MTVRRRHRRQEAGEACQRCNRAVALPLVGALVGVLGGGAGCDRWAIQPSPSSSTSQVPEEVTPPTPSEKVDRRIRVLLLESVSHFEFAVHGPYQILDKSGKPIEGAGAGRFPRTTGRVEHGTPPSIRLGSFTTDAEQVDIAPARSGTLEITVFDSKEVPRPRRYRGRLRVMISPDGMLDVLNVLDMEEYLAGVLCGELPTSFHREAFEAQAIAARTYAFYQKATAGRWKHWDVKSTESSQMYLGLEGERRSARAVHAVERTTGIVCTWKSPRGPKIFCTYYSSTCGGATQDVIHVKGKQAAVPPLRGNVVCTFCSISRYYHWPTVKLPKEFVTERLLRREQFAHLRSLEKIENIRVMKQTPNGRVVQLELIGANGRTAMIRGEDFRLLIGGHKLKSTHFDLETTPTHFVFRNGRGFGHGMGLCQYGAEGQARQGRTASEILKFYYPGCRLEAAYH